MPLRGHGGRACCSRNTSLPQDRVALLGPHAVWWRHVASSIQRVVLSHFCAAAFNHPHETRLGTFLCTEMGSFRLWWLCASNEQNARGGGQSCRGRKNRPVVSEYWFSKYCSSSSHWRGGETSLLPNVGFDQAIYFTQCNGSRPDLRRGLQCAWLLGSCDLPWSH